MEGHEKTFSWDVNALYLTKDLRQTGICIR